MYAIKVNFKHLSLIEARAGEKNSTCFPVWGTLKAAGNTLGSEPGFRLIGPAKQQSRAKLRGCGAQTTS